MKAARSLDLKSLDPQDLFITALAFDAAADTTQAAAARAGIREKLELNLLNAVYFRLAEPKPQPR